MFQNRILFAALIGAGIIGRMVFIYAGNDWVATFVTLLIALGYGFGLVELHRFMASLGEWRHACSTIAASEEQTELALNAAPQAVAHYLRVRLSGQFAFLPKLSLTPFLVGLMVMLGLLGTFLGLVETLQGARDALTGSTELEAVRMGLAAPIQGLSRAFGTSVAGVSASALLGFLMVSVRRQSSALQQDLDQLLAGRLSPLSLIGRQTLALDALTLHIESLPTTTQALGEVGKNLGDLTLTLQDIQAETANHTKSALTQCAHDVRESLTQAVGDAVTQAASTIAPVVGEALEHARTSAQSQFETWNAHLSSSERTRSKVLSENLGTLLKKHTSDFQDSMAVILREAEVSTAERTQAVESLLRGTRETMEKISGESQRQFVLLDEQLGCLRGAIAQADVDTVSHLESQIGTITQAIAESFDRLDDGQKARTEKMFGEIGKLDAVVGEQLQKLGAGLELPLRNVIETSAEAPRAVAKMLDVLDSRLENRLERENKLLQDRQDLMSAMQAATQAVRDSTARNGTTLDGLVANCDKQLSALMERAGEELLRTREQLDQSAAMVATGGVEMAALATMFTSAVEDYRKSNDSLIDGLHEIEAALNHSGERSNEQLSMYVNQAREIIDQSILSQKEMFDVIRDIQPMSEATERPS